MQPVAGSLLPQRVEVRVVRLEEVVPGLPVQVAEVGSPVQVEGGVLDLGGRQARQVQPPVVDRVADAEEGLCVILTQLPKEVIERLQLGPRHGALPVKDGSHAGMVPGGPELGLPCPVVVPVEHLVGGQVPVQGGLVPEVESLEGSKVVFECHGFLLW